MNLYAQNVWMSSMAQIAKSNQKSMESIFAVIVVSHLLSAVQVVVWLLDNFNQLWSMVSHYLINLCPEMIEYLSQDLAKVLRQVSPTYDLNLDLVQEMLFKAQSMVS